MFIIAHRGASGYAPENTLASIKLALKMGCDAIEFDVQLTKDDQLVVCHDFTVDRTTNGSGEIKNLTLEDIKKLDAGSWFSEEFAGEQIPTLEEVLNLIPNDMFLHIEIKKTGSDDSNIEKRLNDVLVKYNRISKVLISSFNHYSVRELKRYNSQIDIGIAVEADLIEPIKYIKDNDLLLHSFHPCYEYVSQSMVQGFHKQNIRVNCWTVNDKKLAIGLKEMGVDSIFTNYPDILK